MKIIGMLPVFNDEDVIQEVIEYLLSQEIELVVLDNGSTDKTYEICKQFLSKGILQLKQFKTISYQWDTILRMLYDMAQTYTPDWVIRSDSDEFLESGIKNKTLKQAIEDADKDGYNLIQFDRFDFFMTDDDNEDAKSVREKLKYYSSSLEIYSRDKNWRCRRTLSYFSRRLSIQHIYKEIHLTSLHIQK